MPNEIDFLDNQPGDKDSAKNKRDKPEEIIWSSPEQKKKDSKSAPFFSLPFLKNNPAAASESGDAKIKKSRREILKLIKHHESSRPAEPAEGKNFFLKLSDKLKSPPEHKKVLVDLGQAFNQEKIKKNQIGSVFNIKDSLVKDSLGQPAPPANKKIKKTSPGWIGRWLALVKNKIMNGAKIFKQSAGQPSQPSREIRPKAETRPVEPNYEAKEKTISMSSPEPSQNKKYIPETNLIKGEIITFFDWHGKTAIIFGAVLAPLALIGLIYYGLIFYQKANQAKNLEQARKFTDLAQIIAREEASLKEIDVFNVRLKTVSQIFSQHIYWTNFFKFLEDNTIKDIYFTGFNGDTGGAYALEALANNYGNIAEQINIIKNNEKVKSVEVDGGEISPGDEKNGSQVKFILNFSVLKNIFTE